MVKINGIEALYFPDGGSNHLSGVFIGDYKASSGGRSEIFQGGGENIRYVTYSRGFTVQGGVIISASEVSPTTDGSTNGYTLPTFDPLSPNDAIAYFPSERGIGFIDRERNMGVLSRSGEYPYGRGRNKGSVRLHSHVSGDLIVADSGGSNIARINPDNGFLYNRDTNSDSYRGSWYIKRHDKMYLRGSSRHPDLLSDQNAYDPSTGERLWRVENPDNSGNNSGTATENYIWFAQYDGGQITSFPGVYYIGDEDTGSDFLDDSRVSRLSSGRYRIISAGENDNILAERTNEDGQRNGEVYSLSPSDGATLLWDSDYNDMVFFPDNRVFITDNSNTIKVIDSQGNLVEEIERSGDVPIEGGLVPSVGVVSENPDKWDNFTWDN